MSQFDEKDLIGKFEGIDSFLALARTVDTFRHCRTVYELFGIDRNASNTDIEMKINAFDKKYAGSNAPKFKIFGKVISGEAEKIKKVLKENRKQYDDYLSGNGWSANRTDSVAVGIPVLVVVKKKGGAGYSFRNIKKGAVCEEKIVIRNPEGGLLQGTIESDVPWLEPDRNKLFEKHEQELSIKVITSKIPAESYKVDGYVTIDTNGGIKVIPFKVSLVSPEIEMQRFRIGITVAGLSIGGILGYLLYYLNSIQDIAATIAGIIGIASSSFVFCALAVKVMALVNKALVSAVESSKMTSEGRYVIVALAGIFPLCVFSSVVYVVFFLENFPQLRSITAWALTYGSFANLPATPIRKAQLRGNKRIPLLWAAGAILLAVTVVSVGYYRMEKGGVSAIGIKETNKDSITSSRKFIDNGDETITDTSTGLMWTKNANPAGPQTWQKAMDFVATMNAGAGKYGYKDWRLPSKDELLSLVSLNVPKNAGLLNSSGYINVQSDYYWSSTTIPANYTSDAWDVNMENGNAVSIDKSFNHYVWPVRTGQ